jgi:3'-phosphoadenosine 5'-phosphosulfate sulfotransferase (PAPS reductase)/FAD synthetase/ferredoxin
LYSYVFDKKTRGYLLSTQTGKYVSSELRPVFAKELSLTGLGRFFEYNRHEERPLLWGIKNTYIVADVDEKGEPCGRKVAQLNNTQFGKPLSIQTFFEGKMRLEPVDIDAMLAANAQIMDIVVADAKRRTKELYDERIKQCDIAYIAFSGGKDSVVLLDICHRVLPLSVPIVFSDTDMELPDTYKVMEEVIAHYPEREFIVAKAETSALENWRIFAPPSRTIRWCCSVHKSTPALMYLKKKLRKPAIRAVAFVGVRSDESHSRSFYEDASDGVKNASQMNCMPILDWGAHELWLYIFANNLVVNCAYRKGLTRVGCLVCPETAANHITLIGKLYPREVKHYCDVITQTSSKSFSNAADKFEFISDGWQARKSGAVLREPIVNTLESNNGLSVKFQSPGFTREKFFEWLITIGTIVRERNSEQLLLKLPFSIDDDILIAYEAPYTGGGIATFTFLTDEEKAQMLPTIRSLLKKVSACVACRCCEAECIHGAISIKNGKLKIDSNKCTKCRRCYDIDNSCWRYFSMREPEKTQSKMVKIHSYKTFGLQESYVSALVELKGAFFPWYEGHTLGKNMVPAARNWFKEALLTGIDGHTTTKLVSIFDTFGVRYPLGWDFVWMGLSNNSVLVNWFVTSTTIDKVNTTEKLESDLRVNHPSLTDSVVKGGLQSLKNMLKNSPFGETGGVVAVETKGNTVKSLTRKAKEVHPLTILYGLYLIANITSRSSFTIRELLTADVYSPFVSPIVAFGITPDTFKRQCEGLRTRYPDFISTTFTHGNDALEVYPQKHTLEDIFNLALEG